MSAMWRARNSESGDGSLSTTKSMADQAEEAEREAIVSYNWRSSASIATRSGAWNSVEFESASNAALKGVDG